MVAHWCGSNFKPPVILFLSAIFSFSFETSKSFVSYLLKYLRKEVKIITICVFFKKKKKKKEIRLLN